MNKKAADDEDNSCDDGGFSTCLGGEPTRRLRPEKQPENSQTERKSISLDLAGLMYMKEQVKGLEGLKR